MISWFVLRLSWIFLLFGIGACFPRFMQDRYTSNLDMKPQPVYQSPPSYVPKGFSLTYEHDSDSEDDTPRMWKQSTYVKPEETPGVPAESRQQSDTGRASSGGFGAWYGPSDPSMYAGGTGPDYGYPSPSAGTTLELSSLGDGLTTTRRLPFEAWKAGQVSDQLMARPPVHPSSLVVQSRGAYERARDLRSDIKYKQNTYNYIPLTEMRKETGFKGQNHH